jgi:HEAT repeat protein
MEKTIQQLKNKNDPERWKAVIELARFGEPAIEHLHQALGDEDKWVRYFAADTLGDMQSRTSVDHLIQKLLDEDQDVRFVTASALGRIGDPRAAHALMQAYNSDNCFVKIFIEEALEKVTAAEAHEQATVRTHA